MIMTMTMNIKEVSNSALEKWSPRAAAVEEASLGAPLYVVLGEAVDVARLVDHHWKPRVVKSQEVPALGRVAASPLIDQAIAEEIRELQMAVAAAHSDYLVLVQASNAAPLDRADFVLSEIRAVLDFTFDDGVHDEADDQLDRLNQAFSDSSSHDAMALALEGYAALAERYRPRLEEIGFDVSLIDEALALAAALRNRSAELLTVGNPSAQRDALALRNRLLTLLLDRVKAVRRAARYVFRAHPDVARKFGSAYERRQRAARRKKSETETGVTAESAPVTESGPVVDEAVAE